MEVHRLYLGKNTRIGHLNAVRTHRLVMHTESAIGNLNWISGFFSVSLAARAEIGARNVISRAAVGREVGTSQLRLGTVSKITAGHKLDLLRSIKFGNHSILAGLGSQLWTHGYIHEALEHTRFRVDGAITIGDDVYIGSSCIFNPGVTVGHGVAIGSQCCVSKDLVLPGLYVNQPLRHLKRTTQDIRSNLIAVSAPNLSESVYVKSVGGAAVG